MIDVKSKAEAIEWISRAPVANSEEVEIRQIYEADDFGPALTPEMRKQEDRLRSQLQNQT